MRSCYKGRATTRLLLLRRPEEVHLAADTAYAGGHSRRQKLLRRSIARQTEHGTNLGPGKSQRVFLADNGYRQSGDGLNLQEKLAGTYLGRDWSRVPFAGLCFG